MRYPKHSFLFLFLLLNFTQIKIAIPDGRIPTPEEFVGFKVGADKKLFGWETVVNYLGILDEKSERVSVQNLGESTLGNPFIMVFISSPMNLMNLAKYQNLQKQAASPYHLTDDDARELARQNKVFVMITLNIHSTEIASSQESIELAYKLATENSPRIKRILDNVIILLIPSMNPDGMNLVVNWYHKYVDTPHEGSRLPYLYHHYAGHDNNRDWFMMNLVETRLVSKEMYQNWFPQIIYDQHQMRAQGARLFLPPYADPLNPNVHPLVYVQMNKFGKHIASDLQAQNFRGIVTDAFYTAWWQGTSVMTPWWHNMLGILSEVAGAQIATPLYFPKGSLKGRDPGLFDYKQQMNFIDPWPGGWWRLRDIINYEIAITLSLLDLAAQEKETIIYNFCKMNKDAIEKGRSEAPFAFIIPRQQHDSITALQMLNILRQGGVEIQEATTDFFAGNLRVQKGDFVILLSQPFRPYIKDLLEPQKYPDLRKTASGPPIRPYDLAGWTLPLMMGVKTVQVDESFETDLTKLKSIPFPQPKLEQEKANYLISHKTNRSFNLVNRLLKDGKKVYWLKNAIDIDEQHWEPGTIYVPAKEMKTEKMQRLVEQLSLEIKQTVKSLQGQVAYRLKPVKLGIYQPWTANIDEGWTRFVLEKFEFPFVPIDNTKIKNGGLKRAFDAIILPDMEPQKIINGLKIAKPDIYSPQVPKEYQHGIGSEGVEKLKNFVTKGGTLIVLDSACDLVIEQFGLPVENVLKNVKDTAFFCPGSLLEIAVDNTEPIAYGMPKKAAALFAKSPTFRPFHWTKRTGVIAHYPDRNPLLSGWILGDEKIRGLVAALDIPMGKGRVVLLGFRAQNRAQTHGTFKLLLNAIHLSGAKEEVLKK